jgi:hypothetical protein
MNNPLVVSTYVFTVVFAFLSAVILAVRFLFRSGTRSDSGKLRRAPRRLPPVALQQNVPAWPNRKSEEHLAPPPMPRDEFEYRQAADYVLNPKSPYPISPPPRRDDDGW